MLALSACGGEELADPKDDGTAGSGGSTLSCHGPGYADGTPSTQVDSFRAEVRDVTGEAVSRVLAQVCGIDVCVNAETDEAGLVSLTPRQAIVKPAFKYGDGLEYAKFAHPLGAGPNYDLGTVTTTRFPARDSGTLLQAGAEHRSYGAVLIVAAGASVEVDPFDYPEAEDRSFRAVHFDPARAPAAVDPALGFELIVALTPTLAAICPPARLSLPNDANWPAGSELEFYLHGVDIEERWAPYAGWAKVSTGRVTGDGTQIVTDADGGIPQLGVIGVRRKP